MIGAITEIIQMGCILLLSNDIHHAVILVSFIALPMIIINSLETAIFLTIILSTIKQEEQMRAVQTHDVLLLMKRSPTFALGSTRNPRNKLLKLF